LNSNGPARSRTLRQYRASVAPKAVNLVIEIAKNLLGPDWLPQYVRRANTGGIERVLV